MKTFAFLVVIGTLGYFGYETFVSPCDNPIHYSIGEIDSRFGVSDENFKKGLLEAEAVWESVALRELFVFDPNASFKVNLIYDDRQAETDAKQKASFGLTAKEEIFNKLDTALSLVQSSYEAKKLQYESNLNIFENKKTKYEQQVDYWNSKGGAPKGEYQKLEDERSELSRQADLINEEAAALNVLASQLNKALAERNIAANDYNKVVSEYNQKYGKGVEFNQAEYVGKAINVYQFTNHADLVLALAHEFGHALKIGHVEEEGSVMYYTSVSAETAKITLSSSDILALNKVCKFKVNE